jgi:hypothetical protein
VSSSRTCPFRLTTCMPPGTRHEPLFLPRPGPALSRPAAPNGWSGQLLYYRRSRSRSLAGHPPPPVRFGARNGAGHPSSGSPYDRYPPDGTESPPPPHLHGTARRLREGISQHGRPPGGSRKSTHRPRAEKGTARPVITIP